MIISKVPQIHNNLIKRSKRFDRMKFAELAITLFEQMAESAQLDKAIEKNLKVLGYGE